MGFLDLPPELRNHIYSYCVIGKGSGQKLGYQRCLSVFRLNRQIYYESRKIFHELNTFIRITTPWEQAKDHAALEGQVKLLLEDADAHDFKLHTLSATVTAIYPSGESPDDLHSFVVVLETGDLERFCTSWFYSSISMPYLNGHLNLALEFHDPYTSCAPSLLPVKGIPSLPVKVQLALLKPFEQIKGLRDFKVVGSLQPSPQYISQTKAIMDTPVDSPEKCLEAAASLKDQGNDALAAGQYKTAIELYNSAFKAIHILINGKIRRVYGDQFFDTMITTPGPFENQHALTVRTVLRVKLVANTLQAYLKLKDWDMVIHTGMRTIRIMRGSIGISEDDGAENARNEAMLAFPAKNEMGKIYYRVGVAYKELDEKSEARKLLKVAVVYLPNDEIVKRELASVALRLG